MLPMTGAYCLTQVDKSTYALRALAPAWAVAQLDKHNASLKNSQPHRGKDFSKSAESAKKRGRPPKVRDMCLFCISLSYF